METNMETTTGYGDYVGVYYWGYIGIVEKKLETTRDYRDYIGAYYWG